MLAKYLKDRSGNFGMMAAILMVPLIGAAGIAVDFAHAVTVKSDLQAAADAAALAAVADSSAGLAEAQAMSGDGRVTMSEADALKFFDINAGGATYSILEANAAVVKEGITIKSVVTFKAAVETTLTKVFGKEHMIVSGSATAEYQTQAYRDFYLLLDNTPSMGVGATPTDVKKMVANTSDKCAFACHIVKNGVEDRNSYYNLAKKLGVTVRINVVAQATASLMDTAVASRRDPSQFRMAIYTFGKKAEDTKLLEVSPLTADLAKAKQKAALIDLMSIPYQGYDNDQQTDFDRALTQMGATMGTPGSGATAVSPEKIVFFVSDGVGDSYKPNACTKKTTNGRCQEPIDTKYCKLLKDKGYKIAVLYTTYLPLPTNGWYNTWIKPFQEEIGLRMRECATDGLFFEVSPTEGISEAMNALFKRIIRAPRLTS
ncbi:pilus assembly protein TadG-related protein [Ensifer sesbaniae]|jgi:hypothetical protein|uniref:pilus assembly protein TadG-related protein n=1 Tax=Ensifer sesbaniae TaxID=1214071 RepID=UPI002000652C|nr:pilus assembly protein TadG-related protein [Ensifer sesbaniae]